MRLPTSFPGSGLLRRNRELPFQRMDTLGMTPWQWVELLRSVPEPIDAKFAHRVLGANAVGLANVAGRLARRLNRPLHEASQIEATFIVGHWRSGTTFLHHLMGNDSRFEPLPQSMAVFPNLHGTPLLMPVLNALGIGGGYKRLMDNVMLSPASPMELEYALLNLTGRSEYLCWTFPKSRWTFLKYLRADASDVPETESVAWREAVVGVTERLAREGCVVLHKNPPSTSCITEIKRLLPRARFVFISRAPEDVFRSTMKTMRALTAAGTLQDDDERDLEDYVFERYRVLHRAYLDQRRSIPPEDLAEVQFSELESDPIDLLHRVYERFGWSLDEAPFLAYLDSVKRYGKNEYQALAPRLQDRLEQSWRPIYEQLHA